jgi:hypothetical protein
MKKDELAEAKAKTPGLKGFRPGNGAKPAQLSNNDKLRTTDPLEFYRAMMEDDNIDTRMRLMAADRVREMEEKASGKKPKADGKKADQAERANELTQGRFSTIAAPRFQVIK